MKTLCHQHYLDQFSRYSGWQTKCADPCNRHKKPGKSNLKIISLDMARSVKTYSDYYCVIPGQKICNNCTTFLYEELNLPIKNAGDNMEEEELPDYDSQQVNSPQSLKESFMNNLKTINSSLEMLKLSAIPEDKSEDSRYINQKIDEIGEHIRRLLWIEQPDKSVGEKVLDQFVSELIR